jgi:uncharacterized protein
MRLLRAHEHRRMPWRSSGGEKVEIAVLPEGAGLDPFNWRGQDGAVIADGPFSIFAGVDRTLTVLDGKGLRLSAGDIAPGSA